MTMVKTYTTHLGDTWDLIAYRVYGNVNYTGWLMENNYPHLDTMVFAAGVVLRVPDPPPDSTISNTPIWRT